MRRIKDMGIKEGIKLCLTFEHNSRDGEYDDGLSRPHVILSVQSENDVIGLLFNDIIHCLDNHNLNDVSNQMESRLSFLKFFVLNSDIILSW